MATADATHGVRTAAAKSSLSAVSQAEQERIGEEEDVGSGRLFRRRNGLGFVLLLLLSLRIDTISLVLSLSSSLSLSHVYVGEGAFLSLASAQETESPLRRRCQSCVPCQQEEGRGALPKGLLPSSLYPPNPNGHFSPFPAIERERKRMKGMLRRMGGGGGRGIICPPSILLLLLHPT